MSTTVNTPGTSPWVVVGCGNWKHETPRPAADLYRSVYIRSAVAWARSYTNPAHLLILSAKYGLIPGTQVIAPYQATFGTVRGFADPGPDTALERPVGVDVVAHQLTDYPGLTRGPVITLAGRAYLGVLAAAGAHPYNPFATEARRLYRDTRLGYQVKIMKAHPGRLPAAQEVPA